MKVMQLRLVALVFVFCLVGGIATYGTDAFAHGGNGIDRAIPINFHDMDVTVEVQMNPYDMTVGNFDNAYMTIAFLEETEEGDILFDHTTYRVTIYKHDKILAREIFYAEQGKVTIDLRPDDSCNIQLEKPWECAEYYAVRHGITGGLYTYGESNPVIQGAIFTEGGLYRVNVEVAGAGSIYSLEDDNPLVFDLYLSIAQEHTFWLDILTGQVYDKPKHLRT